ncbi:phage virion morphogenesis protein [Avibacterium paragallinarum]|uniref:Phage virion morphogenesis protein n=1 Tax=Avibacterium paragallinarum TaxID=728 RepID=A0AAE5TM27_AVIPA|nr:phage virion morphogenesis protein [Avibacterium paragallinarum]MEE3609036.1 phage virion morphogenesis protein [Avibacterium paragallinarum]MEE3621289.1 phage virion morphogenesis protein [Avibacterium paragallinarum]MEE3668553.1 phage virion morphogenesis protein [Avibacterium paragallinarum]MEE3681242.1 phage virion morphogenesis protein [Avibacterium paragallinarum]MEE4386212.1 phage virion morphogenesis protein [Avibacterium paragallinarum]
MATIEEMQTQLNALINNLKPKARRTLARNIGQQLRKSQQKRIQAQKNPDGTAFEPRKPQKQLGKKKGRIKRKAMFVKLRTAKYLGIQPTPNAINIGFQGRSATIANIHQQGLKARVRKDRDYKVQYAQRELLGFSEEDRELIEGLVIEQLSL